MYLLAGRRGVGLHGAVLAIARATRAFDHVTRVGQLRDGHLAALVVRTQAVIGGVMLQCEKRRARIMRKAQKEISGGE